MGKLNIAHHKSYHPYRLDNIERVKKDEEQARLKEEGQEDRIRLADSEARLDVLRGRAGGSKRVVKKGDEEDGADNMSALTTISTSTGHINLFADFEQHAMSSAMARGREVAAKGTKTEDEKGVRLAPSAKDLKPWYVDQEALKEEMAEEKRMKDLSSKTRFDPLTSINSHLSRAYPSSFNPPTSRRAMAPPADPTQARMRRESSERARAMELVRRKQRERDRLAGNATPSSVGGDDMDRGGGYGDVYNRKETEEAHRRRDRGWGGGNYRERRNSDTSRRGRSW